MTKLIILIMCLLLSGCGDGKSLNQLNREYEQWKAEDDRRFNEIVAKDLREINSLVIGMSKKEAYTTLNLPKKDGVWQIWNSNKTTTAYGVREQIVIRNKPPFSRLYLYFRDGKLTGWQN